MPDDLESSAGAIVWQASCAVALDPDHDVLLGHGAGRSAGASGWADECARCWSGSSGTRSNSPFPAAAGRRAMPRTWLDWLIASAGWGPNSVLLLTDQDPAALGFDEPASRPLHRRPTKANLDWGAREWLGSEARPGDVLVVFFAGQAIGLPDRPDDRPGQPPRDYLLPVDARAADVDQTGWKLGDAIDDLARRGEFSIICLLDTSPAGRVRPPGLAG